MLLGLCIAFVSCKKDTRNIVLTKAALDGMVQKGPFNNGSSITINELDNNFSATGMTFNTQILDNTGAFKFSNVGLVSPNVQLNANGFYFNEVTGTNSSAPISLYALVDVSVKNAVNVNVLTHMAKSRIQYLISLGIPLAQAKVQAEQEVLAIFSITQPTIADFDELDISQPGDDNAILLAISAITQGYRTESELSALLADINTDLRTDGILNSASIGSQLVSHASLLNHSQIRSNVATRYANMGIPAIVPPFEKYIQQFLDSTNFTANNSNLYPEWSPYGLNILYDGFTGYVGGGGFSMSANTPPGMALKIKLINGGTQAWGYRLAPSGPINWNMSLYDYTNHTQECAILEPGKFSDVFITFHPGTYTIEYYEGNSTTPTKTKSITIVY